jgi:hypothetical protein
VKSRSTQNTTGANATVPNATAPNATAPNANAPNSTAPNATAPNATAPNATASNATDANATAPNATASNATAPHAASVKPESACSKAWQKWREPVKEGGGGKDWWCTEKEGPGFVLEQKYDCDGDGEIDWTCHDKNNTNSGFIGKTVNRSIALDYEEFPKSITQ